MRRIILLLCCLATAGCLPPYLAVLDSSAGLTDRMTSVGSLGPLDVQTSSQNTNVRFLPLRPIAASLSGVVMNSGFTVVQEGGGFSLRYAYVDSSGQPQVTGTNQSFPLSGGDPNYPGAQFEVMASTATTGAIIVISYTPTSAQIGYFGTVTISTATLTTPFVQNNLTTTFGDTVIGASPSPANPATFNFLVVTPVTTFAEPSGTTNSGSVVTGISSPANTPVLPLSSRCTYFSTGAGGTSYASFLSGSQWLCYKWVFNTSTATQVTGITHRIDALLTDGNLLSTEGGIIRVYDPNGALLTSVSLGGLQFCYEALVGGTAYAFFCLPIHLRKSDWFFKVYAIPTSSLKSLGS